MSHVPPVHSGYGVKNSGEAGKSVRRFRVQIRVMMLGPELRRDREAGGYAQDHISNKQQNLDLNPGPIHSPPHASAVPWKETQIC